MSETSPQAHTPTAYFELPAERRPPVWRLSLFVLLVLGAHLTGLFLAFGVVSRDTRPAKLPVLDVRVIELAPVSPKLDPPSKVDPPPTAPTTLAQPLALDPAKPDKPEKPRAKKIRQPKAVPAAAVKKVAPTPPAVLSAAVSAPATTSFTVAQPPTTVGAAAPAPAPASPVPVVGARFDADYLRNPAPVYPSTSRRLGEEGRVVLRVKVSANGLPMSVEIKQPSGFRRLDEAARAAVERWRFVPARRGDQAVESSVLVPLQFTLNG